MIKRETKYYCRFGHFYNKKSWNRDLKMGIQRLRDSGLEKLRQYENKKSATGLNLLKTEK